MDKEVPKLYDEKKDCCACGACLNVCPKRAISMMEDEYGFLYPQIDERLCIRCGKCKQVCSFQNSVVNNAPIFVYAGVSKDEEIRRLSASGGIFATIARWGIEHGYLVFGAALQIDYSVKHIGISSLSDLHLLQGSKYTYSNTEDAFHKVRLALDSDLKVIFSGTPCQVDGLYGFLGKPYENLYTVDIVCHGVPSNKMFQEYIQSLGKDATQFRFRDKSIGWGINGSVLINGKRKRIWQNESTYLYFFSKGWIYRENCYECKYTCQHRPADLTLGDFWGIERQHLDYLGKNGWDETKGISLVIVNSRKGANFVRLMENILDLKHSTFEKVSLGNGQLRHPSKKGKRDELMCLYKNKGWTALEERFRKEVGWHFYESRIKSYMPKWLKRKLKAIK